MLGATYNEVLQVQFRKSWRRLWLERHDCNVLSVCCMWQTYASTDWCQSELSCCQGNSGCEAPTLVKLLYSSHRIIPLLLYARISAQRNSMFCLAWLVSPHFMTMQLCQMWSSRPTMCRSMHTGQFLQLTQLNSKPCSRCASYLQRLHMHQQLQRWR